MKKIIIKGFIVFHLSMIFLAITHLNGVFSKVSLLKPYTYIATYYQKITYCNRRFPFFAPSIGTQLISEVICTDKNNRVFLFKFPLPNRELELRYNNSHKFFLKEPLRSRIVKSWARYIKARNEDVRKAEIRVYNIDMPTMEEYRKGLRKTTNLYYKKTIYFDSLETTEPGPLY
jgi:hypothetical protein